MRAWVFGYFGHRNLGDEAILAAVLAHAPADLPLRVLTGNERATRATHDTDCCLAPALDEAAAKQSRWRRAKYWLRYGRKLHRDLEHPRPCVYACGGSLSDHVLGHVVNMERRLAALKSMRCSVGLLDVGADALSNPADREAAVRLLTQHVDYCSVRDRASYDNLLSLGVPSERVNLAADAVFSFSPPHQTIVDTALPLARARVAINLRPLFKSTRERGSDKPRRQAEYAAACIELVSKVRQLAGEVTLLPLSPEDVDFLAPLARQTGVRLAAQERRPWNFVRGLESYDFLLGMRFHSIVFSAICALPCLAIPYAPKVLSLAKELALPAEELAVGDGTEMVDQPLNVSAVVHALETLWPSRGELQQRAMALAQAKRPIALQDMASCWQTLRASASGSGDEA